MMFKEFQRNSRTAATFASAVAEVLESRRLLAGIEAGVLVARGTDGNDTIGVRRSGGDDVVVTTNGVDQTFDMDNFSGVRLEGLGGNDAFNLIDPLTSPVVRNTTVFGGAGSDTVSYATRTAGIRIEGYEPADATMAVPYLKVISGVQTDRLANDVETIIGGSGNDAFTVSNAENLEEGPVEFDIPDVRLEGRGGNDSFSPPYLMSATQVGGAGNDTFDIDEGAGEIIFGGDGDDQFSINGESNTSIDAGAGVDTLSISGYLRESIDMSEFPGLENLDGAGSHTTLVFGNALNNRISGETGEQVTLHGLGGSDTLIGSDEEDELLGGEGNDSLAGGLGDDTLNGGSGTDTLDGGPGNDALISGEVTPPAGSIRILNRILTADGTWGGERITIERSGIDDVIVRIEGLSRQFDVDDFDGVLLRGNNGYDVMEVLDPIVAGSRVRKVTLEGGNGNDSIEGSSADDVLRGGAGDDDLHGGFGSSGNDALFGGTGNDFLSGGVGLDFLDAGDDDDFIAAEDGSGGDTVQGGNGFDRASVDPGDEFANVEEFV